MALYNSMLAAIGNTPLVRLNRFNEGGKGDLFAKVEFFNPGGSVKDRVALAMIEAAERDGSLKPGGMIIEPTSGNTGIGLALVAAVKGYKLILTMPETMSIERRKLVSAYGAHIILTPGAEGMVGAVKMAEKMHAAHPNSIIPQQFENPANPEVHSKTTALELLKDMDGRVDVLVAGVGTGGTLSGVARTLLKANPKTEIVAVEPDTSPLLSTGKAGPHKLQGIGANFVPKNLDRSLVTKIMTVSAEDAGATAIEAARTEGLLVGISAGAALHAARTLARDVAYKGKRIAVILPDGGDRYLSTWLFDHCEPAPAHPDVPTAK